MLIITNKHQYDYSILMKHYILKETILFVRFALFSCRYYQRYHNCFISVFRRRDLTSYFGDRKMASWKYCSDNPFSIFLASVCTFIEKQFEYFEKKTQNVLCRYTKFHLNCSIKNFRQSLI